MKIYNASHTDLKVEQIGGKGLNLFKLKSFGLNVPEFVVIDESKLSSIIPDALKQHYDADKIRQFIDDHELDATFLDEIKATISNADEKQFAVRSSAVQEDGKEFSFAGQFETHLYVNFTDIPQFVKEIWKSNFTNRVEQYVKNNNLTPQYGIAVVIQEMIDPDVSGVAFGINPSTGATDSKVVCSVYGVGEGLVSGELNADTFNLQGSAIEKLIVKKDRAARRAASGSIRFEEVESEKQDAPSLSDRQILEIKTILEQLENSLNHPQDIEFAIKNEQVYLLQTRPITAIIKQATAQKEINRIIWDNSNIIESYPGVTTPLTFSYISEAYKNVYIQLARIMGASEKVIRANEDTFANMLGLINGRVYYNLLSWYKVLALFPGYKLNARFMENMMGVKERFDLPKQDTGSKFGAAMRSVLMIAKIIGHLITIKKTSKQFLKDLNQAIEDVKKLDLEKMTAFELKQCWIDLDNDVTPKWKAPVINDSFAMIYFGKLQKLVEKYQISDNKNIQNDLLCGSEDIISVEPIHRSIEMSTDITKDEQLKEIFADNSPAQIWEKLEGHPFKDKINKYIDKFGDRCVGELKLETVSFKQDPTLFIATLKSFSSQNVTTASTASTIDKELRDKAEAEVNAALKFKPLKKRKLRKTIKKTRYFVSNRENLRYERTRIFGVTREIFSQIGKRFELNGIIEQQADIFYLTKEEIFSFIDGTSVTKDLKSLIEIRRKEYTEFEKMEIPAERFTTFGTVNNRNDFFDTSIEEVLDGQLSGLGCCPGKVRAKVRKVKHPNEVESLDGDILVTSSTDPGWVTLFPTASAIIVERGSLLSHSAIVSREMGIPCIVSVTGLLKTLNTGDLIEMDGSTGQIKIIENE
ncbi:MAG: PEP/pyruvate-binding domain-containing protein [Crocinitomicaceae bacterium]